MIRNHFTDLTVFADRHQYLVKVRSFRSPGLDSRQRLVESNGCRLVALYVHFLFFRSYGFAVGIQQFIADFQVGGSRTVVLQVDGQTEDTVLVCIIQGRSDAEILYGSLRL